MRLCLEQMRTRHSGENALTLPLAKMENFEGHRPNLATTPTFTLQVDGTRDFQGVAVACLSQAISV